MAGHRAEPNLSGAPSTVTGTPSRGRRCADVPVDSIALEAFTEAPYVGRRRAAVLTVDALEPSPSGDLLVETALDAAVHTPLDTGFGSRTDTGLDTALDTGTIERVLRGLEPADQTTSFEHEPTAQLPMLRLDPPAPTTAGKRRAAKPVATRPVRRGLPSVPVLAGVAALAVAVSGAILVDDDAPAAPTTTHLSAASALTGTSGQGKVGGREAALTRGGGRSDNANVNGVVQQRNASLKALNGKADAQAQVKAANLWIYPLEPVILTARFGQYGLWANFHTGLDFNGETGDPIHAIADGEVTFTGYDGSYGNKTIVTLPDGTELWYCHQSAIDVSVGDQVRQGQLIGLVGATGNVTGSHLHVEVRPGGGDPVDPYPAMQQHGLFLGDEAQPG